ncbi:S41 family peptidase [Salinimicrobium gaetbulicola]|uniref:S41 family peptidase n=1 Tax=Salinimicrobium gaetbulicola TaxID=999702 RepID=A0ABW3IBM0_9FLAO
MKYIKTLLLTFLSLLLFTGCHEDMDDVFQSSSSLDIKNFIWRGMNNLYLYKDQVPDLANTRFSSQEDLNEFLRTFDSPEDLFYNGLLAEEDEFSFLVDDYVALEKFFQGVNRETGMEYGLKRYPSNSSQVIGYVKYVLPNTSAEANGLERGDLFGTVDGIPLNDQNYSQLLSADSFTIGLASVNNGEITLTGETIFLENEEYTTNPVYLTEIIETTNGKAGYLMYTGFTGNFDDVLNETFAMFKSERITDLIVDLRYNGGGSVESANDLSSMITGQYTGEIFYTEQWNDEYQAYFEENEPESLENHFNDKIRTGAQINSLNLNKVYILTTFNTASASELVINGLAPYINVVQVGASTRGKFQASTTLYDSPDFGRSGANPGHTYAIQPLIYKTVNASGVTDYVDGLQPDILIAEDFENLGVLGDPNEPLLQAALNDINGISQKMPQQDFIPIDEIDFNSGQNPLYQKMFTDENLPLLTR